MITVLKNSGQNKIITYGSMDINPIQNEEVLIEKAKSDADSFGVLYDHYFQRVYSFVYSKVNTQEDAEDITAEVFEKILTGLSSYECRGLPFGAWVFRIARNVIINHYNATSKKKTTDLDEIAELSTDEEKSSPSIKAKHSELSNSVERVIKGLPEREQSILQLKFFSGLNNREIALTMGITEQNVGIILFRTLRKIKPDLKYFV